MELWIRSQNKKRLVKAEHIYYCEEEFTDNELKHHICVAGACDLGVYKTKERALEVLGEIQNRLMPYSEIIQDTEGITISYKNVSTIIYEMPKE